MELIRINENKIKIMLNASDMNAYDLPTEGIDYCENEVREAFRAVLRDAGRQTGVDFSDGRLSIQLYPSRSGGCEMFVTRNGEVPPRRKRGESERHGEPVQQVLEDRVPRWERGETFGFGSNEWLLSVCRDLKRIGFSGNSAAFRDEEGRYFLLLETSERIHALVTEYGTVERSDAVRLYISEHGKTVCASRAVEILGNL